MSRRSGRFSIPVLEEQNAQNKNEVNETENAAAGWGLGRGGVPVRGRGRGRGRTTTALAASAQASSQPGRARGRGRGRANAAIGRNELAGEITRVLKEALPNLIAQVQGALNNNARGQENNDDTEEIGSHSATIRQPVIHTNERKGCSLKTFQMSKPPDYHRDRNLITTMKWVKEVEAIFKITKCADEDRVLYASSLLKGEALYWWDLVNEVQGSEAVDVMAWEQFKRIFREKFCPRSAMKELEEEFLQLEQGNMTVGEYTTRLNERARFAEHHVATEERRVERYIWGLRADIREFISPMNLVTFQAVVEAAEVREKEKNRQDTERAS